MRHICALSVLVIVAGCGGSDSTKDVRATAPAHGAPVVRTEPAPGRRRFVIVPQESKASYIADEEFFPGALKKLPPRQQTAYSPSA
jgi:hypothetical protein